MPYFKMSSGEAQDGTKPQGTKNPLMRGKRVKDNAANRELPSQTPEVFSTVLAVLFIHPTTFKLIKIIDFVIKTLNSHRIRIKNSKTCESQAKKKCYVSARLYSSMLLLNP